MYTLGIRHRTCRRSPSDAIRQVRDEPAAFAGPFEVEQWALPGFQEKKRK